MWIHGQTARAWSSISGYTSFLRTSLLGVGGLPVHFHATDRSFSGTSHQCSTKQLCTPTLEHQVSLPPLRHLTHSSCQSGEHGQYDALCLLPPLYYPWLCRTTFLLAAAQAHAQLVSMVFLYVSGDRLLVLPIKLFLSYWAVNQITTVTFSIRKNVTLQTCLEYIYALRLATSVLVLRRSVRNIVRAKWLRTKL